MSIGLLIAMALAAQAPDDGFSLSVVSAPSRHCENAGIASLKPLQHRAVSAVAGALDSEPWVRRIYVDAPGPAGCAKCFAPPPDVQAARMGQYRVEVRLDCIVLPREEPAATYQAVEIHVVRTSDDFAVAPPVVARLALTDAASDAPLPAQQCAQVHLTRLSDAARGALSAPDRAQSEARYTQATRHYRDLEGALSRLDPVTEGVKQAKRAGLEAVERAQHAAAFDYTVRRAAKEIEPPSAPRPGLPLNTHPSFMSMSAGAAVLGASILGASALIFSVFGGWLGWQLQDARLDGHLPNPATGLAFIGGGALLGALVGVSAAAVPALLVDAFTWLIPANAAFDWEDGGANATKPWWLRQLRSSAPSVFSVVVLTFGQILAAIMAAAAGAAAAFAALIPLGLYGFALAGRIPVGADAWAEQEPLAAGTIAVGLLLSSVAASLIVGLSTFAVVLVVARALPAQFIHSNTHAE